MYLRAQHLFGLIAFSLFLGSISQPGQAQHQAQAHHEETAPEHQMWMQPLGGGWHFMGMGQIFPLVTWGAPFDGASPLNRTRFYPTQTVAMFNIESPGSRFALRLTPNLEGLTIPDGETTFGGWGEGFIDKRHPHTLLHEAILSLNLWEFAGGVFSLSAGRGFAAYGTDDPMARPVQKFPTNHHLSQVLERFTITGAYLANGWNVEGSVFGGNEPEGPYDFSNITPFANSWSIRVGRRFGGDFGVFSPWEVTASHGRIREIHHDVEHLTLLYNAAIRHREQYRGLGEVYALVEGSVSNPRNGDGYFSILTEAQLSSGRHQPYLRLEYATRPEYTRDGPAGTEDFFRYHHGDPAIGATQWLINSAGYNFSATEYPFIMRPFFEVQHHSVRTERGNIMVDELFGASRFWSLSAGVRIFIGGDQMRMGTYGVLDPMTTMHAPGPEYPDDHGDDHHHHH